MSQKNLSKKLYKARSRNWTDNELEEFANVLADDENAFAVLLKKRALKKFANNEVFSQIKIAFGRALRDPDLKKKNEQLHFKQKDDKILEYSILDTREKKLRKKYANLKASWNKISDKAKNESGLSPIREPKWFHIANEIFAENNVELSLVSSAKDKSYLNSDSDKEFDQEEEENIDELNSEQLSDTELQPAQSSNTTAIKKTVAAPHKKRNVVRSQQQVLSHLAASAEQLASSAAENQRLTIEADLKRDKMLIDFKRDEAQKNREHDIQMAQLFENAMMHSYRPPLLSNWSGYPNAKFPSSSGV